MVNNLYSDWGAGYANVAFDGSLPALVDESSQAVPEPSTVLLLSAAVLVTARHLRRRA